METRKNSTERVRLTVRFRLREDRAGDALAVLRDLAAASRGDAGCLRYDLFRCGEGDVLLLELWESRALLDAHLKQAHLARFQAVAGELFACPPEVLEWKDLDVDETNAEER